jgi:hypothetical protein
MNIWAFRIESVATINKRCVLQYPSRCKYILNLPNSIRCNAICFLNANCLILSCVERLKFVLKTTRLYLHTLFNQEQVNELKTREFVTLLFKILLYRCTFSRFEEKNAKSVSTILAKLLIFQALRFCCSETWKWSEELAWKREDQWIMKVSGHQS